MLGLGILVLAQVSIFSSVIAWLDDSSDSTVDLLLPSRAKMNAFLIALLLESFSVLDKLIVSTRSSH